MVPVRAPAFLPGSGHAHLPCAIGLPGVDDALWEIVQTRLVRRNGPVKNLSRGAALPAANSTVRQEIALQQGIPTEKAKDIVKFLKDAKLKKVQPSIQGDKLRVTSPSKDDLQESMRVLREKDFGVALQFGNNRG